MRVAAVDLDLAFLDYHQANPHVYEGLLRLAQRARAAGKRKCGIKMLCEVMRWELWLTTDDPEGWKLNNNYMSRYARLLMERVPDLKGFFELRELRS